MTPESNKNRKLVGVFLLGAVLFNYPILSLFNLSVDFWGIPLPYLYLFSVWSLLIALMLLVTKNRS